jgi:hypothetical protein
MLRCVLGCSSPSALTLLSITRICSSSASFHCPWLPYVNARLAMLVSVSGLPWWLYKFPRLLTAVQRPLVLRTQCFLAPLRCSLEHLLRLLQLALSSWISSRTSRFGRCANGDVLHRRLSIGMERGAPSDCSSLSSRNCGQTKVVERPSRRDTDPKVHYGTIRSGNAVIKDGAMRESRKRERG